MSLSDANAHKALETYFNSNWTATDKFFQEVPDFPSVRTEFVVFKVLWASSNAVSMADGAKYRTGVIVEIAINVPSRTGARRAATLGDQVSSLFLGKQVEGIVFRDKMTHQTEIGDWFRLVVSFNGYYTYQS